MKLAIIFLLILVVGFFMVGVLHEQVHVAIFESYGINSTVKYFKDFPDMTTYGDKPCPTETCTLAHNINEAITYPLQIVYAITGVALFIIILILEDINAKTKM